MQFIRMSNVDGVSRVRNFRTGPDSHFLTGYGLLLFDHFLNATPNETSLLAEIPETYLSPELRLHILKIRT